MTRVGFEPTTYGLKVWEVQSKSSEALLAPP